MMSRKVKVAGKFAVADKLSLGTLVLNRHSVGGPVVSITRKSSIQWSRDRVQIEQNIPQVDEILARHEDDVGDLLPAYRNHVYRMLNFCFALRDAASNPCSEDERQKLIIAGCFHDLGIWPSGTLDYLDPSIELAKSYLSETKQSEWSDEIARIIDQHHKLRAVRGDSSPLVELFRRADLIDVSLGLQRFGLSRSFVKSVRTEFPNLGFHKALVRLGLKQFAKSPWNPMPMTKW